jgi:hypothetical protein
LYQIAKWACSYLHEVVHIEAEQREKREERAKDAKSKVNEKGVLRHAVRLISGRFGVLVACTRHGWQPYENAGMRCPVK